VNSWVARVAPASDDTQHEQRPFSNNVDLLQGFRCECVVGFEHLKDALPHRDPFLKLLILRILGVHDDGNRKGHWALVNND
jgi:hypothetical protein